MRPLRLGIQALATLLVLSGCSADGKVVEGTHDRLPEPFRIELRAFESGRRHVLYRLDGDGSLRFGGGREASGHTAPRKAGVVTDEDRMRLWQIVERHNLLGAGGGRSSEGSRVRYELTLRAGSRGRGLSGDEGTPGLKELDELLFKIQAHNRFEEQVREVTLPGQEPGK